MSAHRVSSRKPGAPDESVIVPVVGVGASAGGLEAFARLLAELPANTGLAFVLVQHLEPTHESNLAEILQRRTKMPVAQVTDGMPMESDHVYVIPPDAQMRVSAGSFVLSPRPAGPTPSMAIDVFLESIAQEYRNRAIGVILSGAASDGTRGMAAIRGENGIGLVQDPSTAEYPSMPQSAINAGAADLVLGIADLAREIMRLSAHPYVRSESEAPARLETGSAPDAGDVTPILERLHEIYGLDLTHYKRPTMARRVERRMVMHHVDTAPDYLALIDADPDEAALLLRDVLVRVTSFFRDPEVFAALPTEVFPQIVGDGSDGRPVRVWVPGCATGQEAYSIVIELIEYLESVGSSRAIQVFASDLREDDLVIARRGVYPHEIESEMSPERLARFFNRVGHTYEVRKAVRDACVFARHDMTTDPPFARLDLVSCRNVLIYMDAVLQRRMLALFHYSLLTSGMLLLGTSEGIAAGAQLFSRGEGKGIFRRVPADSTLPALRIVGTGRSFFGASAVRAGIDKQADVLAADSLTLLDDVLISRYSPATIVVDDELRILQLRGNAGDYLRPRPGTASLDLRSMASEGLCAVVESAVEEVTRTLAQARRPAVQLKTGSGTVVRDVVVIPLELESVHSMFAVLLEDRSADDADGGAVLEGSEVDYLKQELKAALDKLQAHDSRRDAATEELRAANEEIQSSNEELQSVNEELETAKEELQSTNEELTTLNDELQTRNRALSANIDDLNNLLGSVRIPIVMLDTELRVRRYTDEAAGIFHLIPGDLGRPVTDIRLSLRMPDFDITVRKVLDTGSLFETEVADEDGVWYHLAIQPYRTADGAITGVVISLADIDALRKYQSELKTLWSYSEAINRVNLAYQTPMDPADAAEAVLVESAKALGADAAVWLVHEAGVWHLHAQTPSDTGGDVDPVDFTVKQADSLGLRAYADGEVVVETREGRSSDETSSGGRTGSRLTLPVRSPEGDLVGAVQFGFLSAPRVFSRFDLDFCSKLSAALTAIFDLASRDLRAAKLVEERTAALTDAMTRLEMASHVKDIFLANMSHELRTPLNSIIGFSGVLLGGLAGGLEPEQRQQVEMIKKSGDRLLAIITDLLDLEKIEAGAMPLEPSDFVAADAVCEVVALFEPLAHQKGLELVCRPPSRRVTLHTDEQKVRAVLVNLVSNAIKFTESGQVIVETTTTRTTITFRVVDTGCGMSAEQAGHAFDEFQQFAQGDRTKPGGTGLGLTIARRLAVMLGGTLEAESAPGRGSVFSATIRRRIDASVRSN